MLTSHSTGTSESVTESVTNKGQIKYAQKPSETIAENKSALKDEELKTNHLVTK